MYFSVPAVFLTPGINQLTESVTNELNLLNTSVIDLLDHNDPSSGELVQSCKCLRHELNRSDDEIKTIQFINNCLLIALQCFDNTETFIEPAKFTRMRQLITTLSSELKAQGLEASQQLVTPLVETEPTIPLPSALPELAKLPVNDRFDNVENWSMSEPTTTAVAKSDDEQTIISNTTSCTVSQSYDELDKSDVESARFERLTKIVHSSNKAAFAMSDYLNIILSTTIPPLLSLAEKIKYFLTTNIGEKVFLGSLLISVVAVLWALLTGMADVMFIPETQSKLF